MMSMLPNYIFAVVLSAFLIYNYVNIRVRKAEVGNGCLLAIGIVLAVLLLGMSIYGIILGIPLGDVQVLIENIFK